jgi:hypothetical protein
VTAVQSWFWDELQPDNCGLRKRVNPGKERLADGIGPPLITALPFHGACGSPRRAHSAGNPAEDNEPWMCIAEV